LKNYRNEKSNLNENEAFNMVESIYQFYNENAEFGDYHVIGDFKDVYNRSFSISWGILYRFKSPD